MSDTPEQDQGPEAVWALISAHLSQGGTLGDLRGFGPSEYEAIFLVGHTLYGQVKYEDAAQVFAYLVMNNPYDRRFAQALGSATQMQGKWADAIGYYATAIVMDMADPQPVFHTAECLAALGQVDDARDALGFVVSMCKRTDQAALKQRASAMLEILGHQPQGAAT